MYQISCCQQILEWRGNFVTFLHARKRLKIPTRTEIKPSGRNSPVTCFQVSKMNNILSNNQNGKKQQKQKRKRKSTLKLPVQPRFYFRKVAPTISSWKNEFKRMVKGTFSWRSSEKCC